MSLKQNYDFVKEAYEKQGKDVEQEIERVLREGRQRTKASAVNYLMMQMEIDRVQADISGWWIGKVTDIYKKDKYFIFEKAANKLHQIKNYEKDIKPFTPIQVLKADKCKNVRTGAEWIEASEFTSTHMDDKLNIEELTDAMTPYGEMIENDNYLITGTIKLVNKSPIFDPANPGKPTSEKPIIEHTEKGDKFSLRFTITNAMNENINISLGKYTHLLNAYPEEPPADFNKWFASATDENRLEELRTALVGSRIVALGRGGKFMNKDGVVSELKKPYLYVAEDGILVNIEQWENSGGQMKLPREQPTTTPTGEALPQALPSPTPAQSDPQPPVTSTTFTQKAMMNGEVIAEMMKTIKAGKGSKEDLIVELPKRLGIDPQKAAEALKHLKEKGEVYKEGQIYKATENLPEF